MAEWIRSLWAYIKRQARTAKYGLWTPGSYKGEQMLLSMFPSDGYPFRLVWGNVNALTNGGVVVYGLTNIMIDSMRYKNRTLYMLMETRKGTAFI